MAIALYVVVEGDTEERFANQVLVPHLVGFAVCAYVSKVVTRGRRGSHEAQGGGRTYKTWKNDLTTWIRQQGHRDNVWFTTMLDLYGLGAFSDDFPGYTASQNYQNPYTKVRKMEEAWAQDIGFHRFVPHLQLHEFEALLLVDAKVLQDQFIEQADGIASLVAEIDSISKPPEEINDGQDSSPSKRIIRHVPQYDRRKADAGSVAARTIGLARLRNACPHFADWLKRLEQLGQA